jgi:hypothetical protein
MKRRRRRYSCSDGYCGASDCDTCFPDNRYHEIEQAICTWCKKPITEFKDRLSYKEYIISGFCQSCQDETFGGSDE